jgi:hypothetical protein
MGVTIHLYNCTPYQLAIVVSDKDGKWKQELSNDPSRQSRLVRILDAPVKYPLVTVTAKDCAGLSIKNVSFYTWNDYSWIIADSEIRRQKYGSLIHVAEQYQDSEKEANFRSICDYKWKNCNNIKQYDWMSNSADVCLYAGCHVLSSAAELQFLKELNCTSAKKTHAVDNGEQKQTVHIFNDTPYFLDIMMQNDSLTRFYWSDPGENRVVKICSSEKYPFLVITAMDSAGQKLKQISFYTWNDYSWIVTDEHIIRQEYGAALYVAVEYKDSEREEAFSSSDSNYKWEKWNVIKTYSWMSCCQELTLYAAETRTDTKQIEQKRAQNCLFVEAVHLSGFDKMSADERLVADLIVEWVTFSNLYRRSPGSTLITAADAAIEELANDTHRRRSTTSSFRSIRHRPSFRLDYQRSQTSVLYDVFAIQYENRQFATVFIHRSLREQGLPENRLRYAFQMSLNFGIEVWISDDGDVRHEPIRPPDTVPSVPYTLLFSCAFAVAGRRLRLWGRGK